MQYNKCCGFGCNCSNRNNTDDESDIGVFVKEYRERIEKQMLREEENEKSAFISFAERKLSDSDTAWIKENYARFFEHTPNEILKNLHFLSKMGYITSMIYAPDGKFIIVGHSSGLVQRDLLNTNKSSNLGTSITSRLWTMESAEFHEILSELSKNTHTDDEISNIWYPMFSKAVKSNKEWIWVNENYEKFIKDTPNTTLCNRWFFTESGFITCCAFSASGTCVVVGHSSGLIQMRHGVTGTVLCTLRNIQFPPKPVYALEYSRVEERVCYAACMDGAIYRIEIPNLITSTEDIPEFCIKADPALHALHTQFYGAPGISSYATPFITQRSPALSLGITSDQAKMVVGYADTSIKIYDMETQEAELTFKVHKLRLQFIPKKLQRTHSGQVCAARCHDQKPYLFASGAWDNTLRIWDVRCKVGCVMTFEGVNICSDSIDLNREHCIAGSWQPTEALTVWDLVARKRLNIIRVQNRRADVDGEYIYACRYWQSAQFNRKGKYAVIGGSGTKCVEVINLHNRYITCSYPAIGTILAVTSFEDRIAFGGTAPVFNIVTFHDPKHEKYVGSEETDIELSKPVTLHKDSDSASFSSNLDVDIVTEEVQKLE